MQFAHSFLDSWNPSSLPQRNAHLKHTRGIDNFSCQTQISDHTKHLKKFEPKTVLSKACLFIFLANGKMQAKSSKKAKEGSHERALLRARCRT